MNAVSVYVDNALVAGTAGSVDVLSAYQGSGIIGRFDVMASMAVIADGRKYQPTPDQNHAMHPLLIVAAYSWVQGRVS
jgi:hypothetical protein